MYFPRGSQLLGFSKVRGVGDLLICRCIKELTLCLYLIPLWPTYFRRVFFFFFRRFLRRVFFVTHSITWDFLDSSLVSKQEKVSVKESSGIKGQTKWQPTFNVSFTFKTFLPLLSSFSYILLTMCFFRCLYINKENFLYFYLTGLTTVGDVNLNLYKRTASCFMY